MLWNVEAPTGKRVGQAVLISHWQYEGGTHGGPGAPVDEGDLEPAGAYEMHVKRYRQAQAHISVQGRHSRRPRSAGGRR